MLGTGDCRLCLATQLGGLLAARRGSLPQQILGIGKHDVDVCHQAFFRDGFHGCSLRGWHGFSVGTDDAAAMIWIEDRTFPSR